MLLGTLGAIWFAILLKRISTIKAGKGTVRAGQDF